MRNALNTNLGRFFPETLPQRKSKGQRILNPTSITKPAQEADRLIKIRSQTSSMIHHPQIPNEVHQADILYMPYDKVGRFLSHSRRIRRDEVQKAREAKEGQLSPEKPHDQRS
ncbi:unnamed protein product [Rhizophagus irregularis]|nr:unnamed protein product [Rhizophagus irregularis]